MTDAATPSATPAPISVGQSGGGSTSMNTPPPPTPAAPVAAAAVGSAPTDWTTGLNDETRGWVQNKGFQNPAAVIESYRNLEKLRGVPAERLLTVPERPDDAQGWTGVFDKLGRPATPEGYKFDIKDQTLGTWAKTAFHEAGFTQTQAEKFVAKWNEFAKTTTDTETQNYQAKIQQGVEALKTEWGAAHDQNIQVAKRAVAVLGVTPEAVDALEKTMGYDGVMKFMYNLGSKVGEGSFVVGDQKGGGFGNALTPQQAQSRIQALKADPSFVQDYVSGKVTAREEMERLHKYAYPT